MAKHWINTFTGRKVHPLELTPEDICIEDIAHSLSRQCRYTGHTKVHYSIAEHSVLVAQGVTRLSRGVEWAHAAQIAMAKWGLLHDASEAYLPDLAAPVKTHPSFAFYREAEGKIMEAVKLKFGLLRSEPDVVTVVDKQMIGFEAFGNPHLFPHPHPEWAPTPVDPRLIETCTPRIWTAEMAEEAFLLTWSRLLENSLPLI